MTTLRLVVLLGCSALQAVAFSALPSSGFGVMLSSTGKRACSSGIFGRRNGAMLQMSQPTGDSMDRRQAALLVAGTLSSLALPQGASAQGLAGLRKRITGEADGEERAAVRLKKDAKFAACETYQCIETNENTLGGKLARVQLGEISVLAPTKWTRTEGTGEVLASWADDKGATVTVTKQSTAASGLAWKRIPPGTVPAMAKSIVDLDLAQTGLKLATLKGEGAQNTGGKARYLKADGVVMYTIGLKTETEIEVVDVLLRDDDVFKVSVSAPIDSWNTAKSFLSEILSSPSIPKPAA